MLIESQTKLIDSEAALIEQMTRPTAPVKKALCELDGAVIILGAGGKMGPTLAELLLRAGAKRVIAVSRFSNQKTKAYLQQRGIEVIQADLLQEEDLAKLPEAPNVFFLAGFKFGASGDTPLTWALNAWLPGLVMKRYAQSRIVYVSSGNVYSYTSVSTRGADETTETGPVGEYAQSRLGGERIAQHLSLQKGTPLAIVRLFYATELRYGIVHDLAQKISNNELIELSMGHVNQIWQGDANSFLARMFPLCNSPATFLNMTGAEVLSVRDLATQLGHKLDRAPRFSGAESDTALLGNAEKLFQRLGKPSVSIDQIVEWNAHWTRIGGRGLDKPTVYESRSGRFLSIPDSNLRSGHRELFHL